MKRVFVHIDRLVLSGFDHGDQAGIAGGLRAALGRQQATPEAGQKLTVQHNLPQQKIAALRIAPGAQAPLVGEKGAQSIVPRGFS